MAVATLRDLKAVCIHFNALLASSSSSLYSCYLQFLTKYQRKGSREEFNQISSEASLPEVIALLEKKYKIGKAHHELEKEFLQILDKQVATLDIAYGAHDLISYCDELGLKILLINPFHDTFVQEFLSVHHLQDCGYSCIHDLKEITDHLRKEGITPQEAIIIDDSSTRILSYQAMKIPTIKLTHGNDLTAQKWCILLNDWPEVLYLFHSRQTY